MSLVLWILFLIGSWVSCGLAARFLMSLYFFQRDGYIYSDPSDGINACTLFGPVGLFVALVYWTVKGIGFIVSKLKLKDPMDLAEDVHNHLKKRRQKG